jgi:hypothetical protein
VGILSLARLDRLMERDGITMLLDRTSDIHGGSHGRWIEQPRPFRRSEISLPLEVRVPVNFHALNHDIYPSLLIPGREE